MSEPTMNKLMNSTWEKKREAFFASNPKCKECSGGFDHYSRTMICRKCQIAKYRKRAKEKGGEYRRKYKKKIQAYQARYYLAHREAISERKKRKYQEYKELIKKARSMKWGKKNET